MKTIEISASTQIRELSDFQRVYNCEDYCFIVDPDHPNLCSLNGSIYSKDMQTLYVVAPCCRDLYVMPSSVVIINSGAAKHLIKKVIPSNNLQTMAGDSFLSEQILDLSETKLNYLSFVPLDFIDNAIRGLIKLPKGFIKTSSVGSFEVTKHEIIRHESAPHKTLIGLIDLDENMKKKYFVSNKVNKIRFNYSCGVQELVLSETVMEICSETIIENRNIRYSVDKKNPLFFCYDSCLYQKNAEYYAFHKDGDCYSLMAAPSSIRKLHILENTTNIGDHACSNTCFDEITFPTTLERIGWGSFRNCIFPAELDLRHTSVKEIECHAFECIKTSKIYLPESEINIGAGVFMMSSFDNINLQDTKICELPSMVFKNAHFKTITLPATVLQCGSNAFGSATADMVDMSQTKISSISLNCFKESKILRIKLPKNIAMIYGQAFEDATVQEIVLEYNKRTNLSIMDNAFSKSKIQIFKASDAESVNIYTKAFLGCSELKEFSVPEQCCAKQSSFYKCSRNIKAMAAKFNHF